MRNKQKKFLTAAIALAVATAILGATYAYFVAYDSKTNEKETKQMGNGDVRIVEIFNPNDPFKPGVDINKDVWVANTAQTSALVRVSLAEALQVLDNGGKRTYGTTPFAGTTGQIPDLFTNVSKSDSDYTTAKGWYPLSTYAEFDGTFSVPANVTILCKRETYGVAPDPNYEPKYYFVGYYTIPTSVAKYGGQKQQLHLSLNVDYSNAKFKITGTIYYLYYTFSNAGLTKTKWADLTLHAPDADSPIDGTYGTAKKPATLTLPRMNVTSDIAISGVNKSQTNQLQIVFSSDVVTTLTGNPAKKWWYNSADGYFYYIGKLKPGEQTPKLIDALFLKDSAGIQYNLLNFKLIVKMDGILNIQSSVTDTIGGCWGVNNAALMTALTNAQAFAPD